MNPFKNMLNKVSEESKLKHGGFFGTVKSNYDLTDGMVSKVWSHAVQALGKLLSGSKPEEIEMYLDSKSGRHLADELSFHGTEKENVDSVIAAIDTWVKEGKSKWVVKEFTQWKKEGVFEDPKAFYGEAKTIAWDVYLHGKLIDTVFSSETDPEEMKDSLVNHDGYDPNIEVVNSDLEGPSESAEKYAIYTDSFYYAGGTQKNDDEGTPPGNWVELGAPGVKAKVVLFNTPEEAVAMAKKLGVKLSPSEYGIAVVDPSSMKHVGEWTPESKVEANNPKTKIGKFDIELIGKYHTGFNRMAVINVNGKEYHAVRQGMIEIWAFELRTKMSGDEQNQFDKFMDDNYDKLPDLKVESMDIEQVKKQAVEMWKSGKSVEEIEKALKVKIEVPGSLADHMKNMSSGNFEVSIEEAADIKGAAEEIFNRRNTQSVIKAAQKEFAGNPGGMVQGVIDTLIERGAFNKYSEQDADKIMSALKPMIKSVKAESHVAESADSPEMLALLKKVKSHLEEAGHAAMEYNSYLEKHNIQTIQSSEGMKLESEIRALMNNIGKII